MIYNKEIHRKFVKDHKKIFVMLDIVAVLVILMNFGAVAITNVMVTKEKEEPKFAELNPITAKTSNYKLHSQSFEMARKYAFRLVIWAFLILVYFYLRLTTQSMKDLIKLCVVVFFGFIVLGRDFFNDLGFWIGVRIK